MEILTAIHPIGNSNNRRFIGHVVSLYSLVLTTGTDSLDMLQMKT